jgi:hypothetical protein
MENLQQNGKVDKIETEFEKMKIPFEIQKSMMEFFMRTSIQRKKSNTENENHLPTKETDR